MTLGSGASGSMAFAGELAASPKPLPEATTKNSAGSAAAGARIVARNKTYSMRTLAWGMRIACLPPMLQTYALSCHWVFPRCNRSPCKTWKHPQPHQIYSDRRMTNRLDSGQEKSFQKGRINTQQSRFNSKVSAREHSVQCRSETSSSEYSLCRHLVYASLT
jgi:hypothetical protein